MARVEISETVQNTAGQAISGASVQVNVRGGAAATLYAAETGATTVGNPRTTDTAGRIEAWVEVGSYDLDVSRSGHTSYTQPFEASIQTGHEVLVAAPTGNSVTDTAAIIAAWTLAVAEGRPMKFRAGTYGTFTGPALTGTSPSISGQGKTLTTVPIASGVSFLHMTAVAASMQIRDLTFSGGKDVIKSSFTGVSVVDRLFVERVRFLNHEGAAVVNFASDQPYWTIRFCTFYGVNDSDTMSVVLSGDSSGSVIEGNSFEGYRVAIKLKGLAGQDVRIVGNSFLRFSAYTSYPRIAIWVVPVTPTTYAEGSGFHATGNKFGSENLNENDHHVLYADEGSGADIARKLPVYTQSTGLIAGHQYIGNWGGGNNPRSPAFITTSATDLRDIKVGPLGWGGAPPNEIIGYLFAPTGAESVAQTNEVGPLIGPNWGQVTGSASMRASNYPGTCTVIDPLNRYTDALERSPIPAADKSTGFGSIFVADAAGYSIVAGSLAATTDSIGGTDAREATLSTGDIIYATATPTNGKAGFIEIDLKVGSSSPVTHARVGFAFNGAIKWSRLVEVPTDWTGYRFPFTVLATCNQIIVTGDGVAGKLKLGRLRAYHAREPITLDDRLMRSPNGTLYRLTVSNAGATVVTAV